MYIVGITKIKCYHSRKTGTINGFIGVVARKQYFAYIVLTIIKKTNRDNIPAFIMTKWLFKLEESIRTIYKSWKIKYALNCNGSERIIIALKM